MDIVSGVLISPDFEAVDFTRTVLVSNLNVLQKYMTLQVVYFLAWNYHNLMNIQYYTISDVSGWSSHKKKEDLSYFSKETWKLEKHQFITLAM